MVPTFCAEELALGRARAGDGDLPLIGVGGGEPKRESSSSSSTAMLSTTLACIALVFGSGEFVDLKVGS
jgi:hypothetical protein